MRPEIVKSRIPGHPGPSKECGTRARLMRVEIFRGKIRMYLQLHVVRLTTKTISVMEPNFVRMKVSELKEYLQVWGISVANKRREELLDLCIKAHELAIEIIDEPGDQMGVSAKLETDDGTAPDPYSLKSDWKLIFLRFRIIPGVICALI